MNSISTLITEYLDSCRTQKCLDEKTLKAYRIDLRQFSDFISDSTQIEVITDITSEILEYKQAPCRIQTKDRQTQNCLY